MFNGYTNYQTWNVALHIDNNETLYNEVREKLASYNRAFKQDSSDKSIARGAAVALEELIRNKNPLSTKHGMFFDLLSNALDQIDWLEIAETRLED